jgi:tetratricopeptide (TPR) repeat protein/predicted Ser/Thr protein kinase
MNASSDETRRLISAAIDQDLLDLQTLVDPRADEPPVDDRAPDGYELRSVIGHGGGGTVYLAHDVRLDRPVAIKFLRRAGPEDLERFRREARITARLDSRSIVQVHDLGEVEGRPYIVMQYVDGGNLADSDLDHVALARAMRTVAEAIDHAHAEGIVHRDLKPENILLDRHGNPYVTDFGIARDLRGALGETMSHEGQIVGTPGLMPPEQARGEIHAIDSRSDVYALGATLYLKLTGRPPFEGRSIVDVLHGVIHDDVPMPRSIRADIPRELEAIALRCLQKVRDDRPRDMKVVIADLDRYLANPGETGGGGAWFMRLVQERTGAEVEEPVEDVSAEEEWAQSMEIAHELAAWDADVYRVTGSLAPSFARLDTVCATLERILAQRPDNAWARFQRGVANFRRGRLETALEDMERSIDRVRLPTAAFELGRLYLALYMKEHHRARTHLAQRGVIEDLRAANRRLEQARLAFRQVTHSGSERRTWHVDYAGAVERFAAQDFAGCVEICDVILDREPDAEEVWKLRGDARRLAGEDPFESYERALDVRRSYFEALHAKAEAHLDRDEYDAATAALDRAVRIHPEFEEALALLATIELRRARRDDADGDALERARVAAEQAGALNPDGYDAAVTLAEIHLERGRQGDDQWMDPARAVLERARTLRGCQNRVNLLAAQVQLEAARAQRRSGGDPTADLDAIAAECRRTIIDVGEPSAWDDLLADVERERGR